ncbi:MAG: dihydrolipoyl dehydrogenase [Elusimicrobia bacterium]|nr:dihydrolipoyl dehydrogenase [Elusimicrobiota bacterium]
MKVIVIGGGPGGYPAALKLKSLGADVAVVEKAQFGGTCLNRGCIPSKALLEIGHRKHSFEEILKFCENSDIKAEFSWEKIKEHKSLIVNSIKTSLEKLFAMKKIEIISGEASFESESSVKIKTLQGERSETFDYAVIACGTSPFYPPPLDGHRDKITDSDKIFDLEKFPKKLTVIGAGVIGLELSCFFNSLGSAVEIIELMPEILPFEDPQAAAVLKKSFEKRGIVFKLAEKISSLSFENGKKIILTDKGSRIEADEILAAAGRKAYFDGLNLEKAGVEHSKWIKVSPDLKTSNPKIFCVGDANGISLLAHSAERQGEIAAENIFGKSEEFDSSIVPSCIYTWPEIASVGLTKKKAEEKGIKVKVRKSFYQVLGRAVASMNTEGFCQIITDENDKVIGAQIAGGPATEIIHLAAFAVKTKADIKDLRSMIFAHPTMSEIIKEALFK